MDFTATRLSYHNTPERTALLYTPDIESLRKKIIEADQEFTAVEIDGRSRPLLTSALKMLLEFRKDEQEISHRMSLRHDCYTFVVACKTGESFHDVSFRRPRAFKIHHNTSASMPIPSTSLDDKPGDAIFIGLVEHSSPDRLDSKKSNQHYILRVTPEDGNTPLYMSKLGWKGPIVVHSLEEITKFYPAKYAHVLSKFEYRK
jgi:hypothetical protein